MSLKEKLGYSDEIESELQPLSKEDMFAQVEKMNSAPIELIQQHIHKSIRDFKMTVIDTGKCTLTKKAKCEYVKIEIEIMFDYHIIGFGLYKGNRIFTPFFKSKNYEQFEVFFRTGNFARKGGQMYMSVSYIHHTINHKGIGDPFGLKLERSPFAMNLLKRDGSQQPLLMRHIEAINECKKLPPTLDTHKAFRDKWTKDIEHTIHDDSLICNIKDCDHSCGLSFHSQEEYCDRFCKKVDALLNFKIHPQYHGTQNSYCTGNICNNSIHIDAVKTRNPFMFMTNVINGMPNINNTDARGGFTFYQDVFLNGYLLFTSSNAHVIFQQYCNDYRDNEMNDDYIDYRYNFKQSDDHLICPTCYCPACMSFRMALKRGMKYDPNKLIMSDKPLFRKEDFDQVIKYIQDGNWYWNDKEYMESRTMQRTMFNKEFVKLTDFLTFVGNINMEDKKYHIVISNYDCRNQVSLRGIPSKSLDRYFDSVTKTVLKGDINLQIAEAVKLFNNNKKFFIDNRQLLQSFVIDDNMKSNINNIVNMISATKFDFSKAITSIPYFPDITQEEAKKVDDLIHKREKGMKY